MGAFQLAILTYQDFKHKKLVDDRHNWFMFGVTFSLLSHYPKSFLYISLVLVLGFVLRYLINKLKIMGDGDANTILWIFTGFGFLNDKLLISYLIIFSAIYLIHFLLRRVLFRRKENVQGYPVFLISFVVSFFLLNWGLIG